MTHSVAEYLQVLCHAFGCANQRSIAEVATNLLRPFVDEITSDAMGNILAVRHADNPDAQTILLEAHMDEIGFLVTYIDDNGFIHVAPSGGVDTRVLAAQTVMVFGDKVYNGVFCSTPPHLSTEDKKLPKIEDMGIDIGMTADECRACVPLGARVAFKPNFTVICNDLVMSKSLDDRSGMVAILYALQQLKKRTANIAIAFCVQEELGCRGAAVAAKQIKPDIAIVTDVSFADTRETKPSQCGKLGGGVMIGVSPILDEDITARLFHLAQDASLPCQTEVMAGTTGTDADQISLVSTGVPCALLSIPLRYMHTPNEMVCIHDIEAVGNLMALFIEEGLTNA